LFERGAFFVLVLLRRFGSGTTFADKNGREHGRPRRFKKIAEGR
jgi:hypothetical protein